MYYYRLPTTSKLSQTVNILQDLENSINCGESLICISKKQTVISYVVKSNSSDE